MEQSLTPNAMADRVFLALTVWREARGESRLGKIAVACSIMNRVNRPSWWGNDVLSVLFRKWQYSSLTDPRDRQLTLWPDRRTSDWQECLQVACAVLDGEIVDNPVPGADSYHDISIPAPKWATPAMFVGQIGRLRFFNVDGDHPESAQNKDA